MVIQFVLVCVRNLLRVIDVLSQMLCLDSMEFGINTELDLIKHISFL